MSEVTLTEQFLAKIAGWEAVKQARSLLERGSVLSSDWSPPILKGVVQEGTLSYRAGLAIKDSINLDNMCSCRASRQWGTICAHSVAVGLHYLRRQRLAAEPLRAPEQKSAVPTRTPNAERPSPKAPAQPAKKARRIQRAEGEESESASIHVILPPNLEQAVSRGKFMVCFEAEWARGRQPLHALPLDVPFEFSAQDLLLLDCIERLAEGETAGLIMVSATEFVALLEVMSEHPRVTCGKSRPIEISNAPWRVPLQAQLMATGQIRVAVRGDLELPSLITGKRIWVFEETRIRPFGLPASCNRIFHGPMQIEREDVPRFLSQDWGELQRSCDVEADFKLEDFQFDPQTPHFELRLTGGLAHLFAELRCQYGTQTVDLGKRDEQAALWMPDPANAKRYATRDIQSEQGAVRRLLRVGFEGPVDPGRFQLIGQNAVLNFFAGEYVRLRRIWNVSMEERLEKSTAKNIERIEPNFEVIPSGEQWFDLDIQYGGSGGTRFSAAEIQRLLLSGQSYTRLPGGRFAVVDTEALGELQEVLLDCDPQQHSGKYRLPNVQASFLTSTLEEQSGWNMQAPANWRERALRPQGGQASAPPALGQLESVLRPYQKTGVQWLCFLRENQFGGILADEMGLGKTLQTLAYLKAIAGSRQAGSPSLIVCPTSLVFNWVEEARKFTPELRLVPLHGPQRHQRMQEVAQADVVVTSYSLIRRDADFYADITFDTVILDEAQHIKNRQTQNAQAVKAIRSRHRFVLTGTPLENSVLDLWSIFDFLMPGYLGGAKDFRERYELPIVKGKDEGVQRRLARRVRPFLLRRLKREVARELPEKIEQIAYCELSDDQKGVYKQLLETSRQEIINASGAGGEQRSRLVAFNALLRLRQVCCDLRLLNLQQEAADLAPSGKVELFNELLEEVLDGGHRAIVFSQFVKMLTFLRESLEARGIEYCYLDGSTVDRAAVVNRFQSSSSVPLFLISLKAGGVGLNLSGADTVIHFDPWWNPAVEDQATDRAHRIGQTRVVTSYKLITRGTVEEKILALQAKKRSLIQGTLGDETALAEALTWEEIEELLVPEG